MSPRSTTTTSIDCLFHSGVLGLRSTGLEARVCATWPLPSTPTPPSRPSSRPDLYTSCANLTRLTDPCESVSVRSVGCTGSEGSSALAHLIASKTLQHLKSVFFSQCSTNIDGGLNHPHVSFLFVVLKPVCAATTWGTRVGLLLYMPLLQHRS